MLNFPEAVIPKGSGKLTCVIFPSQYVNLRTHYSELTTLTHQYIKFITETRHRLDDEEV